MEDLADKAAAEALDETKRVLMVDVVRARPFFAKAIRDAVAAEREACARLADGWADTSAGRAIAEDIRKRGSL